MRKVVLVLVLVLISHLFLCVVFYFHIKRSSKINKERKDKINEKNDINHGKDTILKRFLQFKDLFCSPVYF